MLGGGASWLWAVVGSMPSVSLCKHLTLDNRVVSSRGFPGEYACVYIYIYIYI